jgi:hypothetical protein
MNKSTVEESAQYDNYMDQQKRTDDSYSVGLDKFFTEPVAQVLYDQSKKKKKSDTDEVWKVLYVHFRGRDDLAEFCRLINQMLPYTMKETWYPLDAPRASIFGEVQEADVGIDLNLLSPRVKDFGTATLDVDIDIVTHDDYKWRQYWLGMPDYKQDSKDTFRTVHIKFRSPEHYAEFSKLIGQDMTEKTKAIWHPELKATKNMLLRWVEVGKRTMPNHPLYIISKTRYDSMFTSRSLSRMQIPHYIVIEPQEEAKYEEALDNFGIRDYVTLIVAPFSNHGDGPGRARNYAWDHSIRIGATWHWVFDDNISDFYRLHENQRIRFESGAGFRAMEDFVERFENVYIAGPQYRFFIAPDQKYPAFVANTRIYSSLLIRNDCKHRWRGRYNEDTDLCLRVLKDGDCTIQFNAFMQGKAATQSVSGGNTSEFYHAENSEKINDEGWNAEGTVNKSQMLVDMHPDVARLVWRYNRWHHWVDYEPFKKNGLRYVEGFTAPHSTNNYGMTLDTNFRG